MFILLLWNALTLNEERSLLRKMVKQVIVEMLGSGNCNRTGPASTKPPNNPLKFDDAYNSSLTGDYSKRMYLQIQREALEVFPALKHLDNKYNNATGFLSYHEAEILTLTLLRLKALGSPSIRSSRLCGCKTIRQTHGSGNIPKCDT